MSRYFILALLTGCATVDLWCQSTRLVDVAGHRVEVTVAGDGAPVVVLEAGLGQDRRHWVAVQDSVSKFTTVVAYSRAGYGASEHSPSRRTPIQVTRDLRTMLSAIDLPGPYVLVGHSLGGLYARVFTRQYPSEVAGLVLVDPTHERAYRECSVLSTTFWDDTRAMLDEAAHRIGGGMPQELDELWRIWRRGTLPEAHPLPDVPMILLTSVRPDTSWVCTTPPGLTIWRQLHTEFFGQTSRGAHIITVESGHMMHEDTPGLVVESIRQMVFLMR